MPRAIAGWSPLLFLGVTAAVFATAVGAFLVIADFAPQLSVKATPDQPSTAGTQESRSAAMRQEATSFPTASVSSAVIQDNTDSSSQDSVATSVKADLQSARVVRTERFEADPSVWANVRKFSPLPPDEVPILDIAPTAASPTSAPVVPPSPKRVGTSHHDGPRAQRHERHRARRHATVQRSQRQDSGDAPSDIGGTRMTAAELERDGSKSPVVSTFSSILGPKYGGN